MELGPGKVVQVPEWKRLGSISCQYCCMQTLTCDVINKIKLTVGFQSSEATG